MSFCVRTKCRLGLRVQSFHQRQNAEEDYNDASFPSAVVFLRGEKRKRFVDRSKPTIIFYANIGRYLWHITSASPFLRNYSKERMLETYCRSVSWTPSPLSLLSKPKILNISILLNFFCLNALPNCHNLIFCLNKMPF